ncbi:hypothetical protein J437_LFUL005199 [Ladona fulva]|uniref:Endosome-associated-trafficking regulator 1 n=1 Tax=Ladona fulva TaxID=123851 RepID=A0A8K0NWL8_LADFU|nr:hypothetical protein J437_LFUL005199 [Ladona fulva]
MIMAEGGSGGDDKQFPFYDYPKRRGKRSDEDDESDSGTEDIPAQPDLGLGSQPNFDKKATAGPQGQDNLTQRSENPFSFKVFLKRDASRNTYSSTGARPKIYSHPSSDGGRTPNDTTGDDHGTPLRVNSSRLVGTPELTSALPDFVQDHLVMEQCYLSEPSSQGLPDLDNLPDFALGGTDSMSCTSGQSQSRRAGAHPDSVNDVLSRSHDHSPGAVSPERNIHVPQGPSEVATSKSLPDFLSDGPILGGRLSSNSDIDPTLPSSHSLNADSQRLLQENERLRWELDMCRRQLSDESTRVQSLERELFNMRRRESEETATLAKSIEQVEDNLKRTTRRAVNAETTVSKLKQEMKVIMAEMCELRRENDRLQGFKGKSPSSEDPSSLGACGTSSPLNQGIPQQVASELLMAANSAEHSLRQLLGGVDNLRVLAATLENMFRIQEHSPPEDPGQ